MPNRIIKESVWTSESLARLSLAAQAFWCRLLPLPDDHGCFDARPAVLRGRLYPLCLNKVKESEIEAWLIELESVDSIRRWVTANGGRWGFIPSWPQHQRIRSLHQRKTPSPPNQVLCKLLDDIDGERRQLPQSAANDGLNPNPNPNPIHPRGGLQKTQTPRHPDFVEAQRVIYESWFDKFQARPTWNGKDGANLKAILARNPKDLILQAWTFYLNNPDFYACNNGQSFQNFCAVFDKTISRLKGVATDPFAGLEKKLGGR